jgi:nitrogen regulatory protein PII
MKFDLIVGFINPEITGKVIKTAKKAGATGDIVVPGKGSGIEQAEFLGLPIQDKTDVVLFVVEEHCTQKILDSISEECKIEDPGNGILLVMNVDKVVGLSKQIKTIRENLKTEQL